MGLASRDQCLPEDKQRHQQGYQEEQGEAEVWDVCVSRKRQGEEEIDHARQQNCRERWLIKYKHLKDNSDLLLLAIKKEIGNNSVLEFADKKFRKDREIISLLF